jgi:hypothetical protein
MLPLPVLDRKLFLLPIERLIQLRETCSFQVRGH